MRIVAWKPATAWQLSAGASGAACVGCCGKQGQRDDQAAGEYRRQRLVACGVAGNATQTGMLHVRCNSAFA